MSDTFTSRRSVLRHLAGLAAAADSGGALPVLAQSSRLSTPISIVVPYTDHLQRECEACERIITPLNLELQ